MLIALPVKSCYGAIQQAVEVCERVGVEVKYLPTSSRRRSPARLRPRDEMPAVRLHVVADDHRLMVKRAMDLAGAMSGDRVVADAGLCAWRSSSASPGPICLRQLRYGYNGARSGCTSSARWCRTPSSCRGARGAERGQGPVFKIRVDPRVTRVGRFMRKHLARRVAAAGQRPARRHVAGRPAAVALRDVSRFSESVADAPVQRQARTDLPLAGQRPKQHRLRPLGRLDLEYIDNWSFSLDMRILFKTVPVVLWAGARCSEASPTSVSLVRCAGEAVGTLSAA